MNTGHLIMYVRYYLCRKKIYIFFRKFDKFELFPRSTRMAKFCLITNYKGYYIVEKEKIFRFNEEKQLVSICNDNDYDEHNGSLFIRNVGIPLKEMTIIDTDDNVNELKGRHKTKKIRTLKLSAYSPAIT
ncbi:hypothetical protein KQX54_018937 [Cotesia glomerata]|uniref:Uncharacterized protein n=1 Tax=Cotesia glomerata TaxID=32391 RepID=A0AAV7IF64_COTGL|nr:hypothetical protein KQX54_018937 [Cotesia glomerata]